MKVLFVGLGSIGQRHLRNLCGIVPVEELDIYAYRRRGLQRILDARQNVVSEDGLEDKYGITVVDSLDDAFAIGMDAVFICNPTSMHLEVLRQACDHSCAIFEEKPLSHTMQGVDEVLAEIRNKKLITYIGFQNRLHPCLQELRRAIDEGDIGEIACVDAELGENITTCHPYEDYRGTYACSSQLGGGVLLSQIHELDYLIWLFGMPLSVYASGGKLSDFDLDVEDCIDIVMTCERGAKRIPVHVHEDFIQSPPVRRCKVVGTDGKIEVDLLSSTLRRWDSLGSLIQELSYDFERNDMFVAEMNEFVAALREGRQTNLPIAEGARSLRVALAAKESIAKETVIMLGGQYYGA